MNAVSAALDTFAVCGALGRPSRKLGSFTPVYFKIIFYSKTTEVRMRPHHFIAIIVVVLLGVGIGVKELFFSISDAEVRFNLDPVTIDLLQMHRDHPNTRGLPPGMEELPE